MTTDLDRLAELGRAVEKTREPFSPGMAGLSWYDEGERDSDCEWVPDDGELEGRIADLEARVRELERERDALLEASTTSVCIFCGETMAKDLPTMLEHAKGCEKRPENRLMAERDRLRDDLLACRLSHRDLVRCEACGEVVEPEDAEDWDRTSDGCDICPPCMRELEEAADE